MRNTWTEALDGELKRLHMEMSAAQIAAELNAGRENPLTRNAIIGRLHRLGLSRPRPKRIDRKPRQRPKRIPGVVRKPTYIRPDDWRRAYGTPCAFLDLPPCGCRWPLGERPYLFCAAPQTVGSPYCCRHEAIARAR
jgi:GcrA cell cycle regulator